MKLKVLAMMSCLTILLMGCVEGGSFCDVEEPRSPTSIEVLQYRIENDRRELNKDRNTNEIGRAQCGWT